MLNSMRGATMAITEAREHECCEKEKEMIMLTTQLNAESSRVEKLENRVKVLEKQIRKTSVCATVAFVVVDKLAKMNLSNEDALKCKSIQLNESEDLISTKVAILSDWEFVIAEAEIKVQSLNAEVEELKRTYVEEKNILMTKEKLAELKTGLSTFMSCMNTNVEHHTSSEGKDSQVAFKFPKERVVDGLKEVHTEMDKLREENKLMCKSKQQNRESMEHLRTQMMEIEFDDAKLVAAQITAQSSCILLKFEEIELL
ncbi:unnamed protein product [Malus baccata var. baccata]